MLGINGAFLAERAGAIDAHLCVWGGVLDTVQVDADKGVHAQLVIVVQRPTEQDRSGSIEEAFTVDIRHPDGALDRRIFRFPAQAPPRPRNGFYWADVLFEATKEGVYTFIIHPGADPDAEDAIYEALDAIDIFESFPAPQTSFEVQVRHDRLGLQAMRADED